MRTLSLNYKVRIYFQIIQYDVQKGLGIIKCDHKSIQYLLKSLQNMTNLSSIRVIGISGTIKSLRKKFLNPFY